MVNRIRLDLSDVIDNDIQYTWMSLNPKTIPNIGALQSSIKVVYDISKKIVLYLEKPYRLPKWETIDILKDGDIIKVEFSKGKKRKSSIVSQNVTSKKYKIQKTSSEEETIRNFSDKEDINSKKSLEKEKQSSEEKSDSDSDSSNDQEVDSIKDNKVEIAEDKKDENEKKSETKDVQDKEALDEEALFYKKLFRRKRKRRRKPKNKNALANISQEIEETNEMDTSSLIEKPIEKAKTKTIDYLRYEESSHNVTCEEVLLENTNSMAFNEPSTRLNGSTPNGKDYDKLPIMKKIPKIGQKIAFKILEIKEDYTPGISDLKNGKVVDVKNKEITVQLDYDSLNTQYRNGKFEFSNEEEEDDDESNYNEMATYQWSDLIDPKII